MKFEIRLMAIALLVVVIVLVACRLQAIAAIA